MNDATTPLLPHNLDAEKALLGSMLVAGQYVDWQRRLIQSVTTADLMQPDHQVIHRTLLEMVEAGEPVDPVLIRNRLEQRGGLADVGGTAYLAEIVNSVPGYEKGEHYAKVVRELSRQRQAMMAAEGLQRIIRECKTPEDAAEAIRQAAERLADIAKGERGRIVPRLELAADWIDEPLELAPELVGGLVRVGEVFNIIAAPKCGKTWLTIHLALCVATGRAFLGRYPCKRGRVLMVDNELHRNHLLKRIRQVAEAMGLTPDEWKDWLIVLPLRGQCMDLYRLCEFIERQNIEGLALVTIDAMYRTWPADKDFSENSNASITDVYNREDGTAGRTGAAIGNVHHSSKGAQAEKSITDFGAGAGAMTRACDTHIALREHEQAGCYVLEAVTRSFPQPEPIVIEKRHPLFATRPDLDPADVKGRKKPKGDRSAAAAVKADTEAQQGKPAPWTPQRFAAECVRDGQTADAILVAAMAAGLSERKARMLLSAAESEGMVERLLGASNEKPRFKRKG